MSEETQKSSKGIAPTPALKQEAIAQSTEPFEVLIEAVNGHRTIRRVYANDESAAVAAVQSEVNESSELGTTVIDSAPAGQGLGST
jgi:hypothetical protein